MATIGLRDVHYALLLTDPIVGLPEYAPVEKVIGAISANVNPNSSSATLFYDDGPGDTATTLGEITLELNLADIPLEVQAIWLGHEFANGILKRKAADVPPWLALGFRTLKSNGAYRYMWLAKGKFAIPEEDYQTKGDSVEFQTPTISGTFAKRDCDDEWERTTDEDAPGFDPSYIATWFDSPITSTGASGTASYGDSEVTISAAAILNGKTVTIAADTNITAGNELSVWNTSGLSITLADGTTYTRTQMQSIINAATGTKLGDLYITLSSDIQAVEGTTATINLVSA